jgi:endonuclease YncB( thermonuclease family)
LTGNVFASTFGTIQFESFEGVATEVVERDTLNVRTGDRKVIMVRLSLVDAPEINEIGYQEANDFVSQHCLNKVATVDSDNNQDLSYGRLVALVNCDGLNINATILASGLANIYGFEDLKMTKKHHFNGNRLIATMEIESRKKHYSTENGILITNVVFYFNSMYLTSV